MRQLLEQSIYLQKTRIAAEPVLSLGPRDTPESLRPGPKEHPAPPSHSSILGSNAYGSRCPWSIQPMLPQLVLLIALGNADPLSTCRPRHTQISSPNKQKSLIDLATSWMPSESRARRHEPKPDRASQNHQQSHTLKPLDCLLSETRSRNKAETCLQ